jgi:hypothetical protein
MAARRASLWVDQTVSRLVAKTVVAWAVLSVVELVDEKAAWRVVTKDAMRAVSWAVHLARHSAAQTAVWKAGHWADRWASSKAELMADSRADQKAVSWAVCLVDSRVGPTVVLRAARWD